MMRRTGGSNKKMEVKLLGFFFKGQLWIIQRIFGLNVCYDTRMEQFMNCKYCNFVCS